MELSFIEKLIKDMSSSNLTVLEIEKDEFKIRLEKANGQAIITKKDIQTSNELPKEKENKNIDKVIEEKVIKKSEIEGETIKSPMVGTFYSAKSPEHPPFVSVGDKVKKGQVLCILEAMKLMNEIECDIDGEIVDILVENEDMVEYDQPLFIIA